MRYDDPMLGMLRRAVYGFAAAAALVAIAALLLSLGRTGVDQATSDADLTVAGMALVLGWAALAAGPAVGLRIGGLPWRHALWAVPLLPLGVLVVALLG